jgi:hypothetical protein
MTLVIDAGEAGKAVFQRSTPTPGISTILGKMRDPNARSTEALWVLDAMTALTKTVFSTYWPQARVEQRWEALTKLLGALGYEAGPDPRDVRPDAQSPSDVDDEDDGVVMTRMGTDGRKWADEFVRMHGGDVGLMLSWFANAIEAGRSVGMRTAVDDEIAEVGADRDRWRHLAKLRTDERDKARKLAGRTTTQRDAARKKTEICTRERDQLIQKIHEFMGALGGTLLGPATADMRDSLYDLARSYMTYREDDELDET